MNLFTQEWEETSLANGTIEVSKMTTVSFVNARVQKAKLMVKYTRVFILVYQKSMLCILLLWNFKHLL